LVKNLEFHTSNNEAFSISIPPLFVLTFVGKSAFDNYRENISIARNYYWKRKNPFQICLYAGVHKY